MAVSNFATIAFALNAIQGVGANTISWSWKKWREIPIEELLKSNSKLLLTSGHCEKSTREFVLNVLTEKIQKTLQNATESTCASIKDCFTASHCTDINQQEIHSREIKATETVYTSQFLNSTREHFAKWVSSVFVPPEWSDVQEILRLRLAISIPNILPFIQSTR